MKSFLSLERPATFTCIKNGVLRKYIVYEGEEFVNYDLIDTRHTDEPNGVKAELIIRDWGERLSFANKAKAKLAYYDTVALVIDGNLEKCTINRNNLFQISSWIPNYSKMHLTLKDVYYPIDWEALDIKEINIPIALRFNLSDGLRPTPSRESYITTKKTKDLIINKIKEVANWFVEKHNSTNFKEPRLITDAYPYLHYYNPSVDIDGTALLLNNLTDFSTKKIGTVEIVGANHYDPHFYYNNIIEIFSEYKTVAIYDSKRWQGSSINTPTGINIRCNKPILVSGSPVGNFRQYLKEKYNPNTCYIVKTHNRALTSFKSGEPKSYHTLLNLRLSKKNIWRERITELQNVVNAVIDTLPDERNGETSKDYLDWLEKKKVIQRLERERRKAAGETKRINKDLGSITIGYARDAYSGNAVVFEKKSYKVAELCKNKFITVICSEDEKEMGSLLHNILYPKLSPDNKITPVKIAMIGTTFISKVPKHFNFITLNQFMKNSRWMKRIGTAMLARLLMDNFSKTAHDNCTIVQSCLPKIDKHFIILENYQEKHIRMKSVDRKILDFAIDNNMFDKTIWESIVQIAQFNKEYSFIKRFQNNLYNYNNSKEQKQQVIRMIARILIYERKHYPKISEFNINDYKTKTQNHEVV